MKDEFNYWADMGKRLHTMLSFPCLMNMVTLVCWRLEVELRILVNMKAFKKRGLISLSWGEPNTTQKVKSPRGRQEATSWDPSRFCHALVLNVQPNNTIRFRTQEGQASKSKRQKATIKTKYLEELDISYLQLWSSFLSFPQSFINVFLQQTIFIISVLCTLCTISACVLWAARPHIQYFSSK